MAKNNRDKAKALIKRAENPDPKLFKTAFGYRFYNREEKSQRKRTNTEHRRSCSLLLRSLVVDPDADILFPPTPRTEGRETW